MTNLSNQVAKMLKQKHYKLTTVESCTGGGVAFAITEIAGSSDWFDRGFVTYSNQSKHELVGVSQEILDNYGAVSEETAVAMAEGGLSHSDAQVAVAITGIAGPTGGTKDKPVGLVWFAWAQDGADTQTVSQIFTGDRQTIRNAAIKTALQGILHTLIS